MIANGLGGMGVVYPVNDGNPSLPVVVAVGSGAGVGPSPDVEVCGSAMVEEVEIAETGGGPTMVSWPAAADIRDW